MVRQNKNIKYARKLKINASVKISSPTMTIVDRCYCDNKSSIMYLKRLLHIGKRREAIKKAWDYKPTGRGITRDGSKIMVPQQAVSLAYFREHKLSTTAFSLAVPLVTVARADNARGDVSTLTVCGPAL
jgi:hypothetical protein